MLVKKENPQGWQNLVMVPSKAVSEQHVQTFAALRQRTTWTTWAICVLYVLQAHSTHTEKHVHQCTLVSSLTSHPYPPRPPHPPPLLPHLPHLLLLGAGVKKKTNRIKNKYVRNNKKSFSDQKEIFQLVGMICPS